MDRVKATEQETWVEEAPTAEQIAEDKAVLRRVDLLLMPTIWVLYLLSYADRTNIGFAKVAGMATDLKLTSNEYSMALVVFFISYIIFQVPSNFILSRTRPSIYIPTIMVGWGMVTCCMAAVKSYHSLVAARFVLGILEAGFAPGVMLLLSSWYKKAEQARRFCVFYSAAVLSGAFGGIIAGAITGNLDGLHGIAGWKWLFIIEGLATIGCAVVAVFILPDFPATSKRLTPAQKELVIKRLVLDNVTGYSEDGPRLTMLEVLKESLTSWKMWLLTFGYTALGGSATMSYFYPTLVAGLGYSGTKAEYMVVPIYSVAFVSVLLTGYFNDKYPSIRGLTIAGLVFVSMVCSIVVCAVYNYTARYVLLVFIATGLLSGNGLAGAYASSTFATMRQETRAVSLATVNGLAGLSQIYGAYLFPSEDAPKYLMGFGVISGLSAVCATIYLSSYILFRKYPTTGV